MLRKLKLSPFIKDILLTKLTSIATIISLILVTRFLATGLGPEEFGFYSLTRRLVSTILTFSTFMMGVSITRYVALAQNNDTKNVYYLGGLIFGILPTVIIAIVGFVFHKQIAYMIYHNTTHSSLLIAALFMLAGYSFYNILYAIYRGLGKMRQANVFQFVVIALAPFIIVWLYSNAGKADQIVMMMGGIFYITLIPICFYIIKAIIIVNKTRPDLKEPFRELFHYGFLRVPGAFAVAGLLSSGPFLAQYLTSTKDVGYLTIGISILSVMEGGTAAFGIVILPKVTQLFAEGKNEFIKERVTDVIAFIFHIGLFCIVHLSLWSEQIVLVWLGNQYTESVPIMKIFILAIIPYLTFTMLRQILNAIEKKPLNTINSLYALAISAISSLVLVWIGLEALGLAIGSTIGIFVLGLLTVKYLWRLYKIKIRDLKIIKIITVNIVLCVLTIVFKYFLTKLAYSTTIVLTVICFEILMISTYFIILNRMKIRWITELKIRLIRV